MAAAFRVGIIAAGVAVSVGYASAQTIAPPPAGAARVVLSVDKPAFFLGENVLVHYCLENLSSAPFQIDVGGDDRAASRSVRFKTTVTDEHGAAVPDPDPSGFNFGGAEQMPTIAPHDHWCQSLALMRYARIDQSGTYSI